MTNVHSHIKSKHPELSVPLSVPESARERESSEKSDVYGLSELSSESSLSDTDEGSVKKSLDFSAIRKHISAVIFSLSAR